jgi:hypothetical protein
VCSTLPEEDQRRVTIHEYGHYWWFTLTEKERVEWTKARQKILDKKGITYLYYHPIESNANEDFAFTYEREFYN